jgi:uncharacterized cupredoxin-like copper-binding protein
MRTLRGGTRGRPAPDPVVQRAQTTELLAVRELREQAGTREAVLGERCDGVRARLVVRRPAEEEAERPVDELLVRQRGQLEVGGQPLVHSSIVCCDSLPAVLVQALSTGHKIGLGVVAGVFIAFALSSAFLFPRFRSSFPGRGLPAFIVVAFVFFLGMLTAVEVFGAEKKEKGEEHAAEPTTTQEQSTATVVLPPPTTTTTTATTTTAKPKPKPKPQAQTVDVTETDFKIALPSTTLKAGPVTFDVKNDSQDEHDLIVMGNGITAGTPRFGGGQSKTLKVALKPGTYKLFCSVPGHEQLGMKLNVTVTK